MIPTFKNTTYSDRTIIILANTMIKEDNKQSIEYAELFRLDYINNYLTLDRMCEDYYMSIHEANNWLNIGRYINNKKDK